MEPLWRLAKTLGGTNLDWSSLCNDKTKQCFKTHIFSSLSQEINNWNTNIILLHSWMMKLSPNNFSIECFTKIHFQQQKHPQTFGATHSVLQSYLTCFKCCSNCLIRIWTIQYVNEPVATFLALRQAFVSKSLPKKLIMQLKSIF